MTKICVLVIFPGPVVYSITVYLSKCQFERAMFENMLTLCQQGGRLASSLQFFLSLLFPLCALFLFSVYVAVIMCTDFSFNCWLAFGRSFFICTVHKIVPYVWKYYKDHHHTQGAVSSVAVDTHT